MSARRRCAASFAAAGALTGALVLAAPLAAGAHVGVDPVQAEPGEAADLTFSVPNESGSTTTTRVRISLPDGLGEVAAEPVTGWTDRVVARDGSTAVVFTAGGEGIGDGQTQRFVVRVSSVPDTGSVLLPVAQTSSDGTVVEWDEPVPASGEEPERPAPVLYVNDEPPADHHGEEAAPAASPEADGHAEEGHEEIAASSASGATSLLPLALSSAALVVALGALAVAVAALLRRRR